MRKFVITAILLVAACNTQPPNQNPNIASFSRTPSSGVVPLTVVLSWSISDPDSDSLTCKIDVNNDGTFEYTLTGCTSSTTQNHTYSSAGTFTAKLRIEDGKGGFAEKIVSVTVNNNQNPTITNFQRSPSNGVAPLAVAFSWTIDDPDGDPLTCKLDVNNDGTIEYTLSNCTSSTTQNHTYSSAGGFTAKLRIEDSKGGSAEQTVGVTVTSNNPPLISSFTPTPNSGNAPLGVSFGWSISDPNADALTCKLDVNNDGSFEYTLSGCTSSTTQNHTYNAAGSFTAKLRVEDGKGGSAEQTVSITVSANNPPAISSFTATPSSGNAPLSVNFSWSISDPNGDALVCKLDINNDGTVDYTLNGCTSSSTQSHTYTAAGTFTAKLRVEDSKGASAEQTKSITVTSPPADAYDITLRFSGSPTAGQQAAFTNAAAKWSQVITTGFPSINLTLTAGQCVSGFAAFSGSVDDILIDAQVTSIDGPGGILGQAGPCLVRTSNNLSVYGIMKFDSADIANLEASGQLVATIFHEMGHVLGVGTLWNFPASGTGARNLLQGAGTTNPRFVGTKAVAEWQALGGTGNVPVENCLDGSNNPIPGCGAGTKDSHWREAIFNNEIMTGYLDAGTNPLSRMTIGSMEDLGYIVNYGAADPFTLLKAQSAQSIASKQQLKVELITPVGSVGP